MEMKLSGSSAPKYAPERRRTLYLLRDKLMRDLIPVLVRREFEPGALSELRIDQVLG
jgi:hypothetical protein